MTIESLAESLREAKVKARHLSRIKYPKKLKGAAIEYFKANPSLTPSRMASKIGISTLCCNSYCGQSENRKLLDRFSYP